MNDYPTLKVMLCYGLLGGFITGILVSMSLMIVLDNDTQTMLDLIIMGGVLGLIIGFIPAILTGFILAKLSAVKDGFVDYALMFMVGGCVSMGFALLLFLIISGFDAISFSLFIAFIMALFGGASSVIIGSIFLPKSHQLNSENSNDYNVL